MRTAAGRPADNAFSYLYANLSTPKPSNSHCTTWDPLCRSTIHYPDAKATGGTTDYNIQPLWNYVRQTFAANGVTVLTDHTCVLCHTPVNAAKPPPSRCLPVNWT